MRLAELARAVPAASVVAGGEAEITGVAYDSRRVRPGDLFVAVRGIHADGHDYAAEAASTAAAVAVEREVAVPAGTPILRLADSRTGLAELAAALHGRPGRKLRVAGVTGTDGKTTVTHMAAHILNSAGRRAGAMSTVAFQVGGTESDNLTGQTTTESPEVQERLAAMVTAGMEYAIVEATSHALVQQRVAACEFDVAAYTYVGHDHLDYHATWEDYLQAKSRLIDLCAAGFDKGVPKTAVLNRDDASFDHLAGRPIARRMAYSIEVAADVRASDLVLEAGGARFTLVAGTAAHAVHLRQPARFNVQNALCAAGICLAFGLPLDAVASGLSSFGGVRGRLEQVELGQPFRLYIDFAHAAGALRSVLTELRAAAAGRLIVVFGSTGRSDHDRPGMGRAAAEAADFFVITSDDPVREDPAEIARQVAAGAVGRREGRDYEVVLVRREAIRRAVRLARPGDVVLLAGKGHERTMITAAGAEPWDERAEAEAAIRELRTRA